MWITRCFVSAIAAISALAAQSPQKALEQLRGEPGLNSARLGVLVVDLGDGRAVCRQDETKSFVPASSTKLITTAVALDALGPDYRFATEFLAHGEIVFGVLEGDLELVGSGDPTLGSHSTGSGVRDEFDRLAASIRESGIQRITGRIIGNDDAFPDLVMGSGWAWDDASDDYSAQISGLCFAENCVELVLSHDPTTGRTTTEVSPDTDYVTVTCSATVSTEIEEDAFTVHRNRAANDITVKGTIQAHAEPVSHRVTIENPTLYAAHVFRESLIRAGVQVDGAAMDRDSAPGGRHPEPQVIATLRAQPVKKILAVMNKTSQNLYAEQLLRAAALQREGSADMAAARTLAESTLSRFGVTTNGMMLADGSGLSRYNLATPTQLVGLLAGLWKSEFRDTLMPCLAIAGKDGTLSARFIDSVAQNRVLAKTGSMTGVHAVTGFVPRPGDDRAPLAFTVIVNNSTAGDEEVEAAIDAFIVALAHHAGWQAPPQ